MRLPVPIRGKGVHLVAIDPGHGGIDEGTYPYNPDGVLHYSEAKVTLQIALRLSDILVANGIRVFLVRDGDYEINPQWLDVNQDGELDLADETQARLDLINASGAELLLSIHLNARTYDDGSVDPTWNGTATYYCNARPFSDLSLRFADLVQKQVLGSLSAIGYLPFDQGVHDDLDIDDVGPQRHLVLLGPHTDRIARPGQMPTALNEALFATGYEESVLLSKPEVLDALAQAYSRAIILYLNELDNN
ncbi:MAG: N-acetylmuramoyl-L-alanine amidase family protein [Anaerolineae bacterium]